MSDDFEVGGPIELTPIGAKPRVKKEKPPKKPRARKPKSERVDNTVNERGKRYKTRQADRKLVRVHPWVPENRRKELLDFAEKLRKEEAANDG